MLNFQTTSSTKTASPGSVISWHVQRTSSVVLACLSILLGVSQTLTAGCHSGSAQTYVEVGLHLDELTAAPRPVAEGCWWYSGLAKIVYEEGRLKYFPALQDKDCDGPGCRKKPTGPGLEPVATTSQRNTDASDSKLEFHDSRPAPSRETLTCNPHCIPNPFLPGILRPPCAA